MVFGCSHLDIHIIYLVYVHHLLLAIMVKPALTELNKWVSCIDRIRSNFDRGGNKFVLCMLIIWWHYCFAGMAGLVNQNFRQWMVAILVDKNNLINLLHTSPKQNMLHKFIQSILLN